MMRLLMMAVVVLGFAAVAPAAEPAKYKVSISNKGVGKSSMSVSAQGPNGAIVGAGKLVTTNGFVYPMLITSGSIVQGHYAVLSGNLSNGLPFQLYGDSVTGTIKFVIKTSPTGPASTILSKGTVLIQGQ